jgi:hypothetical protein
MMTPATDDRIRTSCETQEQTMDVILLAAGLAFFVVSIAYAYGCERL